MFDLKPALENWKKQLNAEGSFRNEDIQELEVHLEEEIDALHAKGLSLEESFLIASKRLGHSQELSSEFVKTNARAVWAHRFAWMFFGSIIWGMAGSLLGLVQRGTLLALNQTALSKAWMIGISSTAIVGYVTALILLSLKLIQGASFCQRLSSLKRWGVFALLLIVPKLVSLLNSTSFMGLREAMENREFVSAYTVTSFVIMAIQLTASLTFIYFISRHFSKNKRAISM